MKLGPQARGIAPRRQKSLSRQEACTGPLDSFCHDRPTCEAVGRIGSTMWELVDNPSALAFIVKSRYVTVRPILEEAPA